MTKYKIPTSKFIFKKDGTGKLIEKPLYAKIHCPVKDYKLVEVKIVSFGWKDDICCLKSLSLDENIIDRCTNESCPLYGGLDP
jgi:hypothetical protein